MIALLGPPPPSLLARAKLRDKFFSDLGELYNFFSRSALDECCYLSHQLTFLFRKVNSRWEFLYLTPDHLRNEKRPFEQQRTMEKIEHLSSASCGRCYNGNPSNGAPPGTWQRTSGFFDILPESKVQFAYAALAQLQVAMSPFLRERESGVGSALEVLIIDLVYSR